MSQVTVELNGQVTVTEDVTEITTVEVTTNPITVEVGTSGLQGATGAAGTDGVANASAPITYDSTTKTIGIDQNAITIAPSQVTGTAVVTADSRLSDARTPTTHASTHASAGADPITIAPGQVTGTTVITTDSRLSDSRTPTAHANSHKVTGSDTLTLDGSQITTGTIAAARVATLNQNTTGTAGGLSASLATAFGGTGQTYGAALIGRATLSADRPKASVTGVEAAFWDSAGTTVQYINLDPDTLYSFDGYIQVVKDGTSCLPSAQIQYYSTGTTALTPQAISCQIVTRVNTAVIGGINITAANATVVSVGTANTSVNMHWQIAGVIRTNATTGGRLNIACGFNATLGTVPTFRAGSYLNIVKHGTGNPVNFGNWTA